MGDFDYLSKILYSILGIIFILGIFSLWDIIRRENEIYPKTLIKILVIISPVFIILSFLISLSSELNVITIIFIIIRAFLGVAFVAGLYLSFWACQYYLKSKKKKKYK